ncbi:MAG: serine/threonine protein kinase, partial [Chloroflexota bacterium]|nr:serine/threonine protein kinase [Chloroflexota bacterium]
MKEQLLRGRYRLIEMIGEGGMATVYRAWDTHLERSVAIKMMRPDGALSDMEQDAFLAEARMVAKLNHPNIVTLYDAGVADGQPFLVMELLPGWTLRQRLTTGPLPVAEARYLVDRIAAALEAAHAQRVLHLDVKPENVLFDARGEPKLSD